MPSERMRAGSFAAFSRALAKARPVIESLRWSVALAHNATDHDELRSRVVADQMLRGTWRLGAGELPAPPVLSDDAREVARSLIGLLTHETDAANAAWLARRLAERGWPKASDVGRIGANDAWLLAQNADADPALQLRALRAMEPLVAAKEADAASLAYLHDRVMLKLSGRQRYGTQLACIGGERAPLTLENAAGLDARRAEVGMPPIAAYLSRTDALVGPCPPDPAR